MKGTDTEPTKGRNYRCRICGKAYNTSSHLRRHESGHSQEPSSRCPYCRRGFLRQDALRRHFKTCSKKGEYEPIPSSRRGRRRHACNSCHAKKINCDGNQPCGRCSLSQIDCSYLRVSPGAVGKASDGQPNDDGMENSVFDGPRAWANRPLPFLLSYTDPKFESIAYAFAASGASAQVESVCDAGHDLAHSAFADPVADLAPYGETQLELQFDEAVLQARIEDIIRTLASHHRPNASSLDTNTSTFPFAIAEQVFAPHTLPGYVSAYFQYFHPHFSFIHRPTFDIHTASLPLLLAVALSGAANSPPTDDALTARTLYGVAEEYIFDCLHDMVSSRTHVDDETLQTVQAAGLMNALLYDSNKRETARRELFYRFPVFVASIRSLGLVGSKRIMPLRDMTWEQFIAQETRIRLVAAAFYLGGINTISFNSAVQLPVSEMVGDLPCADALFEAETPAEFERLREGSTCVARQDRSLKEWMSLYLQETWPGREDPIFTSIEPKLLTIHIVALHSIIHSARTSLLSASSHPALLRATDRWKELYDIAYTRHRAGQAQLLGYIKYSIELWWLARKLLEQSQAGEEGGRYLAGTPTDSLLDLREFVRRYAQG